MLPGIKRVVYVNYTSVKTKTKEVKYSMSKNGKWAEEGNSGCRVGTGLYSPCRVHLEDDGEGAGLTEDGAKGSQTPEVPSHAGPGLLFLPRLLQGPSSPGSHRRQHCPEARTTMALEEAASCVGMGMQLSLAHLLWGSRERMARKGAWTAMSASMPVSPCYIASCDTSVG